ncbi:MAG: cytochrome c oxidase subunit 3 [Ilumatobacteraceae bacterium]
MHALPAAAAPAPQRRLITGTVLAAGSLAMFFGGMLAVWMRFRNAAPLKESSNGKLIADWLPKGVTVHDVAANLMLMTLVAGCFMAQMAVYAAKRKDNVHVGLGLGVATLFALAVINAQAFEYSQMAVPIRGGVYHTMFYAITGSFLVLMIVLSAYTVLAAFRYLGGRTGDREVLASVALSWYATTGIYIAVWFLIYVTK